MNPVSPKSEGSTREPRTIDPAATHHWACGMPLSYVLEMAEQRLTQREEAVRLRAQGIPEGGNDAAHELMSPRLPEAV